MSMLHHNNHLLCAVDVETTGLDFKQHDIIQVCALPLDSSVKPSRKFRFFSMDIKPSRPENIDLKATEVNRTELAKIMLNGVDSFFAADLFMEWFERLHLEPGKKLLPLGHNWVFDHHFLQEWLGEKSFNYIFHHEYRDSRAICAYLNDVADVDASATPFIRTGLIQVANKVGLEVDMSRAHNAVYDCLLTAEVYRRQLRLSYGFEQYMKKKTTEKHETI